MAKTAELSTTPRLKALYKSTIVKELQAELKLENVHQVPKLEKIVVSVGIGKNKDDKRYYEVVRNTLTKITGQHPIDRMAKKSIATFKIRAGMNRVGINVTLRGARMYEFLDRYVNVSLPRTRDFHGVSAKAFDKAGNYNIGIVDQSIFPELTFEETQVVHGLQITMVISGGSAVYSRALLEKFGIPFEKQGGKN
ncbi:50S ribosomal protein L5 [Candidatus Saccharibacteria bacterium HGW-Saccharibacteria-1]|jgi:large subunit ribosomal protein L5|nr:ribosomal protein L5 [uncultured bacterium]PKL31478.1 MAG: 50S ribosomal protein L5 [Candidatus Saccharibacteria bacterium HGW-Saccharibacteria-1]